MRVKTFHGRTLEEILPEIRQELGPDAVVLGQRQIVNGGVGGFFGKRMVEVTAADRMPSDSQLIDLEDRIMGREGRVDDQVIDDVVPAAAPMVARSGSIDIRDDWDPADDVELAGEYGSVLQQVARARADVRSAGDGSTSSSDGGAVLRAVADASYEPLELPQRASTVPSAGSAATAAYGRVVSANQDSAAHGHPAARHHESSASDPMLYDLQGNGGITAEEPGMQARRLAVRAHEAIAAATEEIERQLSVSRLTAAVAGGTSTFRAEVVPSVPQHREGFGDRDDRVEQVQPVGRPAIVEPVSPIQARVDHRVVEAMGHMQSYLHGTGVDHDVAEAILHGVVQHRLPFVAGRDMRDLTRDLISETISVDTGWPSIGRTHRIALVGASGAGKSSVVAKLAEGYAGAGLRVGVVSLITGAASSAQIAAYANDPLVRRGTLDIQFAADPEQMIAAMERYGECDVVLVDTPSAAYLDRSAFVSVTRCLTAVRIDDVQVVIPLATSVREAESVVEHFRPLGLKHLVVSKLDESRYAGQLLNFGFRFGLPMTFLTDGPRVPEDIRAASAPEIAALIVPHQHEGETRQ